MESFIWPHKDLLDVDDLTVQEVGYLLDTAEQFQEVNSRPVKKVPTLRGKGIILFFAENSTRTKTSFDMAGKRLSADTFSLAKSGSSLNKGESLKDTALTLEAMRPDVIVIRHSSSGAARFLAERLDCSIVNAGDGWHAHPTQALLDAFSLRRHWRAQGQDMAGKSLLIVGDVAHSRVARSNIKLMAALGLSVRIFAPRTLLPMGVEHWPAQVYDNLEKAVSGVDAVMCLRLQLERQAAGLLPDLSEYAARFCITLRLMNLAVPGAPIMHPGPMNRGLEVASDLADSPASLVLDQVNSGVAVRMAILYILGTRNEHLPAGQAEAARN
ncbi:MAG: aspartate carbamoyltransferase catalytic subunit [Deltaproteobacteria bacterium]|jgi:aspartate carbamoyltransferase catalytic subunit|nr:aspartate carbamoyltransferase catalytic subunit [Deltaproteobacteria bacterium]